MAKWTSSLKKPWRVRGWGWVFLTGIVLTILAMIDAPAGNGTSTVHTADESTGCQLRVSAAELRVRSAPRHGRRAGRGALRGRGRRRHARGHGRVPRAGGRPLGRGPVPHADAQHELQLRGLEHDTGGPGRIRCDASWCHAGVTGPAHRNVDLVLAHLRAGGAAPRALDGMLVLPDAVTTAAAAAAALGVEVGQIAELAGVRRGRRAAAGADLRRAPGRHGQGRRPDRCGAGAPGVSGLRARRDGPGDRGRGPVGHPAPLRTLVDRALEQYAEVWAAGGIPHAVFPTTCAELIAVTGAASRPRA